jgi:glycosyltransferase involved in cell wall biosynthesis
MKKVLIVLPSNHSIPPTVNCSGISWLIHGISNKINSSNFTITLLSIDKQFETAVDVNDIKYHYIKVRSPFFYQLLLIILGLLPYSFKKRLFFSSNDKKIARCLLIGMKLLFSPRYDLILYHVYPTMPKIAYLLGVKTKSIFYFHGSGYATAYKPYILNFINNYCSCLITISNENIKKDIFASNIYNILNAVELSEYQQNINNDLFNSIIFAGSITENKGVLQLISAVINIINSGINVKLTIAGDKVDESVESLIYFDEVINLARNFPNNIFILGRVNNRDLQSMYKDFKIGVLLSQYREGNSLFLMECLSNGIPVVATKVGGIPEVVDDGITGLLVNNPKDIKEIESAIKKLLSNDTSLYQTLKNNTLDYAKEKFSYNRAAKQLEIIIEKVINSK